MNNLHQKLVPVSEAAWLQIEEEASRMLKRRLAARRVAEVKSPKGYYFSAVGLFWKMNRIKILKVLTS